MRNVVLGSLVLLAAGALVFVLLGGGDGAGDQRVAPALPAAQAGQATEVAAAEEVPAPARPTALVADETTTPAAPAPSASGPRTLDGTVSDRFGQPMARERVWLVEPRQGHPPTGAVFGDYVTALTSSKGVFSLTLRDDGPYRLAIGPPGEPRLAPSEARVLAGRPQADVIVPGGTSLHVTFEGLPAGEDRLELELLTLREGATTPEEGRGRGGRGFGGGGQGNRGGRGPGGDAGGDQGGRRGRGGGGQQTMISLQDPPGSGGVQDQAARRGRGGRDRRQGGDAEESGPPQPPPEVWRALTRRSLTQEEIAAGSIEIGGLPPGRIARLALLVGDERLEGLARFTLLADVWIDVRVFPVVMGEDTTLDYVVTSRGLGPSAPVTGIRWRE